MVAKDYCRYSYALYTDSIRVAGSRIIPSTPIIKIRTPIMIHYKTFFMKRLSIITTLLLFCTLFCSGQKLKTGMSDTNHVRTSLKGFPPVKVTLLITNCNNCIARSVNGYQIKNSDWFTELYPTKNFVDSDMKPFRKHTIIWQVNFVPALIRK